MKRRRVQKHPIDPDRIRGIPASGFSWIDRRFVRDGFLDRLPPEAALLYFFLVAVSDAQGLSFYADPTVSRMLKLSAEKVTQARTRLVDAKLILYAYPLYQVLPLPAAPALPAASLSRRSPPPDAERGGDPMSLAEMLAAVMAHGSGKGDPS
jgi:hypothetical protein